MDMKKNARIKQDDGLQVPKPSVRPDPNDPKQVKRLAYIAAKFAVDKYGGILERLSKE